MRRKQRSYTIDLDMGRDVSANRLEYNHATGPALFSPFGKLEPERAYLEVSYPRDQKRKVISRAELPLGQLLPHPDVPVLACERVLAVDTNTREIQGTKVSATALVIGEVRARIFPPTVAFQVRQALELHNVDCSPERLAWKQILESLERRDEFRRIGRVALVVDSDYSALHDIRLRKTPILDNFFLPANVILLYATADTGDPFVGNLLLREADKRAADLLNQLERTGLGAITVCPTPDGHASFSRMWHVGEQ